MGHPQEFPVPGGSPSVYSTVLIGPEKIVYSSNILIVCKIGEILCLHAIYKIDAYEGYHNLSIN